MKKIPGSREEDTWFDEDQLDGLVRADEADDLRGPIPTQMVSNGEYLPNPQTEKQKEVEFRIRELAERVSKKLGISRRKFLGSSGGIAASFIAMNEAHGAEFFKVSKDEMFEPDAHASNAPPRDLFVFDDQLHTIRSSRIGPGNTLRDIAEGNHSSLNPRDLPDENGNVNFPWNPKLVGLENLNSNFHLVQFMKDVYINSQVTIGVLSNNTSAAVPDQGVNRPPRSITESEAGEFLTATQTASVRDWVNGIAGSTRMLAHGQLFPGAGNQQDPVFQDYHRWQIENLKPDSWKGYTSANSTKLVNPVTGKPDPATAMTRWRLDDENGAVMFAVILEDRYKEYARTHPGFYNICIHKGLSTGAPDGDPPGGTTIDKSTVPLGFPDDIPNAARMYPKLNFLIYHSCIKSGFWMGTPPPPTNPNTPPSPPGAYDNLKSGVLLNGVPNIHWSTQFFQTSAPFRNVYAELGTTFASSVITFPSVCAHLLGQALKYLGEDRIVFGSDSVWYGSPQWQIEALWRFQIPDRFPSIDKNGAALPGGTRQQWGYPQLTETAKRKILGLNNARLYGIRNVNGRLTNQPEACEDEGRRESGYHPVPSNYASLIPLWLRKTMEFPGFAMDDKLSRMRREYLAMGGPSSNTRYGWLRKRG